MAAMGGRWLRCEDDGCDGRTMAGLRWEDDGCEGRTMAMG